MIEDLLDGSEPHSGLQPAAKDVSVHGSDASEVESNQVSGETVVSSLENESVNNESVINTNTIEEGENLNNPHDKNDKCEPENTDQKKRGLPIHRTPLKSTPIRQKHIPTKTIKTPLTITKANSTGKGVAEQTDTVPQQKSSPKKSQSNTNGNTKSKPHSKKSRIVLSDEEKSESGDSNHSHHELGYIPDDVATEDEDGSGQSLERTTSAEDTEATVINRKRGRLPKKSKGTVSRLNYTKKTSVVQKEVIRHTGGDSDEEGVRRSKRMKIEPLAYWKNEKAIYGPEETGKL
ncbi:hypothetical protein BC833DRAFT_243930 [Globomyces pollinis-pini]|nr:hypothetical protein BC833DRAFT_243930 [Globomyces pollinis-pini]